MSTMKTEELDRLEELEKAATPGPWECAWGATRQPIARAYSTAGATDGKAFGLYGAAMVPLRVDEDMELCASLRNAAPALIAAARENVRLREVVEAARAVIRDIERADNKKTGYEEALTAALTALDAKGGV